ncbi:4Fe-4S binding protein [Methanolobus sp. WCC4]|uniref:4Fe-4S binding protein n=1 Tax=Methanolobus sp. WCC4 TaxID=3125784 RepID=UPI0030FA5336
MNRQEFRKLLLIISFFMFPLTIFYFSPYIIVDAASKGIVSGSMVVFALLFLSSLVFGRLWCGWFCASGACQSILIQVNGKDAKGGRYDLIKYLIWTVWIFIIAFLAASAGGLHTVNFFYHTENVVSIDRPLKFIVYYVVIAVLLVLSLAYGKRAGCHYICWMAPFMVIGRKIRNILKYPSLRLKANKDDCINCRKCSKICPMSLDVNAMVSNGKMENSECILCGECVDTCPKDVISYSFSSGVE